jgi:hypothetical protein
VLIFLKNLFHSKSDLFVVLYYNELKEVGAEALIKTEI